LVDDVSNSSVLDELNSFNNRLLDGISLIIWDSLIDSISNSFVDRSNNSLSYKFNSLGDSSVIGKNNSFKMNY